MEQQPQIYPDLREGFNTYWEKNLCPLLKSKEKLRKKYVARFWCLLLLALFVLPAVTIGIYVFNKYFQKNIDSGLFFIVLAVFIFLLRQPFKSYKKRMKNDTMQTFINYFKGFTYEQGKGLSLEEIDKSHIFPSADIIEADDCFEGSFQDVRIRVCEQIFKNIQRTKRGKKEVVVFQGIAVELAMNKNFQGQTVVLKDSGFFNRFKGLSGFERIRLEDPQFEKLFEVYGTDQVEARYLLTPVFMERIIKLKDLYKSKSIQLSFHDNNVLIAVKTKEDMFEPYSFFKTNLNKQKIDRVFEQFLTVFSIVDILKLAQKVNL